jgi:hypothetical protein
MAAPNIVNVSQITANTNLANVTTVVANVVTNSASSGKVYKVNNIQLANYGLASVSANVIFNRSSASPASYYIAGTITVPTNSTLVVVAKDTSFYMEEGDVLQMSASANSILHGIVSYEVIS